LYDAAKASRVSSPVGRHSGERAVSGTAFGRQMAERGVTKLRGRTGLRYQGLVGHVGLCRVSPIFGEEWLSR